MSADGTLGKVLTNSYTGMFVDEYEDCVLPRHQLIRQVGELRFAPDGLARSGLLVRHLVMPGLVEESRWIFAWLHDDVSADIYVKIMGQYRPEHRVRGSERYPDIGRRP